jgi:hypothetical protein
MVREFFGRIICQLAFEDKNTVTYNNFTNNILIFKRLLFKTKNSRIHEPPNGIEPYRFFLVFS